MEFDSYKAKIYGFAACFAVLADVGNIKEDIFKPGYFGDVIEEVESFINKIIANDSILFSPPFIPLPVEMLTSIKSVNLAADMATITQQAEAVKQEIISLGESQSNSVRGAKVPHVSPGSILIPESKGKIIDDLPMAVKISDYIRNSKGKIVFPFDYWEDCINVYLLKHLHKRTNGEIVRNHSFKTSNVSVKRSRDDIVAKFLAEAECIIAAVQSNNFPPKRLPSGKQPSMLKSRK